MQRLLYCCGTQSARQVKCVPPPPELVPTRLDIRILLLFAFYYSHSVIRILLFAFYYSHSIIRILLFALRTTQCERAVGLLYAAGGRGVFTFARQDGASLVDAVKMTVIPQGDERDEHGEV